LGLSDVTDRERRPPGCVWPNNDAGRWESTAELPDVEPPVGYDRNAHHPRRPAAGFLPRLLRADGRL